MKRAVVFLLLVCQVAAGPEEEATWAVHDLTSDLAGLQASFERWDLAFHATFEPAMAEIIGKMEGLEVDPLTLTDLRVFLATLGKSLGQARDGSWDDFESLSVNLEFVAGDLSEGGARVANDLAFLDKFSGDLEARNQVHKVTVDVAIESSRRMVERAVEDKVGYLAEDVRQLLDSLLDDLSVLRDDLAERLETFDQGKKVLWAALVRLSDQVAFLP